MAMRQYMAMALEEEALDDEDLDASPPKQQKQRTSRKAAKAAEQGKGKSGRRTANPKPKKPADGGGEETRASSAPAAAALPGNGKTDRMPDSLVQWVLSYSQQRKPPVGFEEYNTLRSVDPVVSDDDPVLTPEWIKQTRDLLDDIAALYEETEPSLQEGLAEFRNEYEERGYIEVGEDYHSYMADVQEWSKKCWDLYFNTPEVEEEEDD
uniref:Uncharacterized protein n=1 Tax=Oryza glumipatula TaxID=40148 RepID=A0A0D9ZUJ3_9ORYZ